LLLSAESNLDKRYFAAESVAEFSVSAAELTALVCNAENRFGVTRLIYNVVREHIVLINVPAFPEQKLFIAIALIAKNHLNQRPQK
jgi:hypothetical protein